ncbi:hybrid sensor histidine kinase/response regulator [Roseateles sp. BYS87W]|uniref:histidine kinase n=1 Tax=Pelomonas baiyunensis TaxID=3299026 RepID=A0ABW7GY65_9BURK
MTASAMPVMPGADDVQLLIVDDLAENRLALSALVQEEGVCVHTAASGEAALDLLLQHEFALALLDVQMPEMSGFELAELIRGSSRTAHLPIVFVTASDRGAACSFRGYDNGAVDVLYKPLDPQAVRSKVRVFTELHRNSRLLRRQLVAVEAAHARQELLLAELQATQDALQRALRMRDEFMSLVSHELRTPLGVMTLDHSARRDRLARGDLAHFTPERLQAMAARDARQLRSMTRLIDDMLDTSRIQHGRLSIAPRPTDLGELARHVADDLAGLFGTVPLDVQATDGVAGCWDDARIAQVLANLLANALRHGQGRPVAVQVSWAADGRARLAVQDQGEGVPAADQQRIFEAFERGAASGPGLGLGLFISRHFVHAHGGEIRLHSTAGQGACFEVLLPTSPPAVAG